MCEADDFDHWAESYEEDVIQSDQAETFPFAGYTQVLDRISNLVLANETGQLLDLGTGSGTLASRFYQSGWQVTAVDFSEEMLNQARQRMPNADFILSDFSLGLPRELEHRSFDFIVMTYAFHHLKYEKQADFVRSLMPFLNGNGKILIGDITFETQTDLITCQKRFPGDWDEEEFYPILTEIQAQLHGLQVDYEVVSFCAGIIIISSYK